MDEYQINEYLKKVIDKGVILDGIGENIADRFSFAISDMGVILAKQEVLNDSSHMIDAGIKELEMLNLNSTMLRLSIKMDVYTELLLLIEKNRIDENKTKGN